MASHPQVESITGIESTTSSADSEPLDAGKKPIHISIRLIGDKGIGKASIIDRYLGKKTSEGERVSSRENASTDTAIDQGLSQEYSSSITVDGREVILHIWSGTISKDFEWHPLAAGVFNEGLMFVFDSTDEASYESIKQQFDIYYLAGDYSNRVDKPEVILVGTNCCTDNKIRFYDWVLSELTRYMEDHTGEKFIGYYETNFESGANLRDVFDVLINKVLDNCDPTRREMLSPIESPPVKTNTKIDFVNSTENRQATRSDRKLLRQNLNKAKRQHGKIPVRFLKVFFTGSGAAGKTSFVRLLLKKKFNEFHHSTNVIHTNHAVSVKMAAFQGAPTKKVAWVELDSSLELGYLRSVLLSPPSKALSHPPSPSTARRANANLTENTSSSRPAESQGYQTPIQPESTLKSFFAGLFASSVKVSDLATFENLVSSSTGKKFEYQPGQVLNIITLLDTGGQPEYIHLLPTINIYPTVTFVVHNLAKNITDQVLVEFSQHGKLVFAPYHLSYSNLDMIKLLMSAANDSVERPTSRIPQLVTKPGTNNKSYICLVGTHVDEVSPDVMKKTDKALTKLVRKTQCEAAVWQKANGTVLFPVNNTTSGSECMAEDPVADEMRKRIEKLAAEKEVYELPITWMLLELEIQQICSQRNKAYISFQECVAVARDTGLISEEEEVKSVLQYHHLLGVLIYFEEVAGLCDYVIVDHQWWFDKLSGIICITFQQGSFNFHAVQRLKYQGILSKELLKHVEWKDDIKEEFFLCLLTHMKIIAPLFSDRRKKGEKGKRNEYFIPYVLPTYNFAKKKDEILKQYGHLLGEPLLIQFKSGLLPRGLFCSLIVELLQHPLKNWEPHFSNDKRSHTFSNLFTFSLPNMYSLSLLDKVSYLEVHIRHPEEHYQSRLSEEILSYPVHNKVYNYLVYAITEVCIRLNFCDDRLQYGFLCQNCEYSDDHIAVLPLSSSSSSMMYAKCSLDSLHQMKMTDSNMIWFVRDQTAQNGQLSRSVSMASSVDSGVSVNIPTQGQFDRTLSIPVAEAPNPPVQLGRYHSVPSQPMNQGSARSAQYSTNLEVHSESNLHEMTHSVSSLATTPDGPTGTTTDPTGASSQQFTENRYDRIVSMPAGMNPYHEIEANSLGLYGRSISVPQPHHQFTHGLIHSASNLVTFANDATTQQPTERPSMKVLHQVVIPRIAARWSMVADFLEYELEFKEIINLHCHHDPLHCCDYLLRDWLRSNRGVSPKSWSTLIGTLSQIKPLAATVEKIVEDLKQQGINV